MTEKKSGSQAGAPPQQRAERLLISLADEAVNGPGAIAAEQRVRLLIIDNQPIEPPVAGGRLRLHGLFAHMPSDIEPIYVGTYDWRGPVYREIWHNERLLEVTVPQSEAHFAAHEALRQEESRLGADVTFPLLVSLSEDYRERVTQEALRADAIVVEHPWAFAVLREIPSLDRIPLIYDAQNVESRIKRAILGATGLAGHFAEAVERIERDLCRRAWAILACSEEDATDFQALYRVEASRIHVVPNGVDTLRVLPAGAAERSAARALLGIAGDTLSALFLGSDYPPNVEAARFVVELAAQLPAVQFLIAGGCSSALGRAAVPKNVRLLGPLDDSLREAAYAASDIALNPMMRGSGTNIKMLDYLAAGLPTVTTPVGARGLPGGPEPGFLIRELSSFPEEVSRLSRDPRRRAELASRARRLVKHFDWRILSARAARVVRQLVRQARAAQAPRPDSKVPRGSDRLPSSSPPGARGAARPRIAFLSTWRTRCGIAGYTEFLVRAFPRAAQLRIYAEAASEPDTDPGLPVARNWVSGAADLSDLERSLRRDGIDLLFVQYQPAFFSAKVLGGILALARRQRVRTAVTFHSLATTELSPALLAELQETDRVFLHRASDAGRLAESQVQRPVRVVPQGVPRFPNRSRRQVRSVLGLPEGFWIGHFGYLRPHKGTIELIESFDRLVGSAVDARLLLLCSEYPSPDSQAYRRVVEDRIAASPHRDRIHFTSSYLPQEQLAFLLQACDVVAFPYRASAESASAAVRFGIAARRAVLVSEAEIFEELGGIAEVSKTSADQMSVRLSELASSPERLESSVEKTRRFAASCDWARVAARTWGHLRPLLS